MNTKERRNEHRTHIHEYDWRFMFHAKVNALLPLRRKWKFSPSVHCFGNYSQTNTQISTNFDNYLIAIVINHNVFDATQQIRLLKFNIFLGTTFGTWSHRIVNCLYFLLCASLFCRVLQLRWERRRGKLRSKNMCMLDMNIIYRAMLYS
jgi:hypothetical protein